ncbi:MAG: HD-GYP domain-containing protein [Chloroflexi bacterium]|nr:HD-GYP domain-containing protein [Chloroflexota bacterium]
MRAFPKSAQAYVWLVIAAAASTLLLGASSFDLPVDLAARLVLALLIVSNVFADYYHIHLYYKIEITMSTATNFAAMMIFGPVAGCAVGAVGSIGGDLMLRKPWYKILFNSSSTILSISASSAVYHYLNDGTTLPLTSGMNAIAIAASGLSYLIVNNVLVCLVISLVEGHRVWEVARINFRGVTFQLITAIPLGTLISIVYYQTPWALALLLFPILVTHDSFESYQKLRSQSKRVLVMLADAVDKRDPYTFQHSLRVGDLVERTARKFNVDLENLTMIVFAARIHDLGKIGINSSVLLKPGKLDPAERAIIEQHPVIGARMISPLSIYHEIRGLIEHHHERLDGSGYPRGLKGDEIPLGARIIAVADAFDAMTTDRPYRKALSLQEAVDELNRCAGTQFDARVVAQFVAALEQDQQSRQLPLEMDFLAAVKDG